MGKVIITIVCAVSAFILSSCGVGNYTVSSGIDDKANVCFVADNSYDILVTIDGKNYNTKTVKEKEYKSRRNIKKTVQYSIPVATGTHTINVVDDGRTVYSKKIVVSTGEIKIIKL